MDSEKFKDLMISIAVQNSNLEQNIQELLKDYEHKIGDTFNKFKPTEKIDQKLEHENICAVPNSAYLYSVIVDQIDEGREVVNLGYDKRLRLTGYTTALRFVAKKYTSDNRVVVIVDNYKQLYQVGEIMPDEVMLYTSGSDSTGISGVLRSSDIVLIDNSVKKLSEAAKRDIQSVIIGTGTAVTLNDLGL